MNVIITHVNPYNILLLHTPGHIPHAGTETYAFGSVNEIGCLVSGLSVR